MNIDDLMSKDLFMPEMEICLELLFLIWLTVYLAIVEMAWIKIQIRLFQIHYSERMAKGGLILNLFILTLSLLNVQALKDCLNEADLFFTPRAINSIHADEAYLIKELNQKEHEYDQVKTVGPRSPPGPPGRPGPRGAIGLVGPSGSAGAIGSFGPIGPIGPSGPAKWW